MRLELSATEASVPKGEEIDVPTPKCIYCEEGGSVVVPRKGHMSWARYGTPLDEAFPDLPGEVKIQLSTGIHPKCYDESFPPEIR